MTNDTNEKEISLGEIRQKMGSFFDELSWNAFRALRFLVRNAIAIVVLFILGVVLGVWLDNNSKSYDNKLIVTPNFGSGDYLYSKVGLIQAKIAEGDTMFLKSIGIKEPKQIASIKIKPVIDIYPFINRDEDNFELIKLMAENGDINKVIEEPATSKNYAFHQIIFKTRSRTNNDQTVQPLIDYLNKSDFFKRVQDEYLKNSAIKMKANERTISQINGFLDGLAAGKSASSQVYINENAQLNDVIQTKDKLVQESGDLRMELVSVKKIVRLNSQVLNVRNTESVNGKLKLVIPILFVGLFIVIRLFIAFYKKQSIREKQLTA